MTPLTPPSAAPPADLLAVAQSKAVPRRAGFRDSIWDYHPDATGFQHPWKGVLFIEDEPPCYAGPCDARRSFWAYACGWSYDWRRCGAPDASKFSYFGYPYIRHDSGSYDPTYPSGDYDYCSMTPDIPQATMTPAPKTPDIHQATMTSAPTTLVSYPFRWKSQGHRINGTIPFTKAKGKICFFR